MNQLPSDNDCPRPKKVSPARQKHNNFYFCIQVVTCNWRVDVIVGNSGAASLLQVQICRLFGKIFIQFQLFFFSHL